MTKAPLHDAAARRMGRNDFARPLILEAGAGTGKTAVLVARVVHWCLGQGWARHAAAQPGSSAEEIAERVASRVVAITFTDAAAVEMQQRVARALRAICAGQPPVGIELAELELPADELRARAAALASCAERLRIQTIHGFCSAVLRESALEAGLHPGFTIDADGQSLRGLAMDLVGRRFDELYGEPGDPDARQLAAAGFGPAAVADQLRQLCGRALRAEELPEDPFDPASFAGWREALLAALEQVHAPLAAVVDGLPRKDGQVGRNERGMDEVATGVARVLQVLRAATAVEDLEPLLGVRGLVPALPWRKIDDYARGKFSGTEEKHLAGRESAVAAGLAIGRIGLRLLKHFDSELLRAAMRLMRRLLDEAGREMQRLGLQCFDGLLRETRRLLATRERAAVRLREGIDQLLVDEFQDTDAGQCELVARLALDELPTSHRPGLFLVGDPKQSIYGWRSADLGAYESFVARVRAAGGELAVLDVNFRSVPPILAEVERSIGSIMLPEAGRQPEFQALHPAPDAVGKPGFTALDRRPVEHWVAWSRDPAARYSGPSTTVEEACAIEAQAIAEDLAELRAAGELKLADAALLLRSTTKLETYLSALREAGVPYQVERDRSYYRRREIIDAAAWVRAVVDPHDQLALVAALRAPTIGVPDAAWLPLWQRGFPEKCAGLLTPSQSEERAELRRMVEEVAAELAQLVAENPDSLATEGLAAIPDWHHGLLAALDALAALRQSFRIDPADEFVAKLRAASLQEPTEAARFLGAHRLANLERFYRRLTLALQEDLGGPQAVVRALRVAVADEADEAASAPGDDSLDAVRVMTVHKAKGLTFAHVYLAGIHGGSGASRLLSCEVAEHAGRFEFCLCGVPTLGWGAVQREREAVEEAERVRLLYVALTRPQQRLVVSGSRRLIHDGAGGGTLEALLRGRFVDGAELLRAVQELSPQETVTRDDADGVRWRVPLAPDAARLTALRQAAPRADAPATDPAAWLEESASLRRARESARRWSARDRMRTASRDDSHEAERLHLAGGSGEEANWARAADPALARSVGTAVHLALERLDLDAEPVAALQAQLDQLESLVRGSVPARRQREVVREASALLRAADASGILHELFERRAQILGREVPVLLRDDTVTGAIVGTLDLLYRDPASGRLTVADFKTDAVRNEEQMAARAAHYATQAKVYCEAVAAMFPDEEPPVFELWFLAANRIWSLAPPGV